MQLTEATTLDRKSGEAERICGAPEPQTKAPTSEFAGLAQTFVAWERGCPQFATPGVCANRSAVKRLVVCSEQSGVCEEQTPLARSANSLEGAFVWGSGAPQILARLRSG